MEDYFTSKLKIVEQSETVCINLEMDKEYEKRIYQAASAPVSYTHLYSS